MNDCACEEPHDQRTVVLTGGPGAGKTAVLELLRRCCCRHLVVLPEAAGVVFGGGFPRGTLAYQRRAAQRAIFHVQRELESLVPPEAAAEGTELTVDVRGRPLKARVVPRPFYRRPRAGERKA